MPPDQNPPTTPLATTTPAPVPTPPPPPAPPSEPQPAAPSPKNSIFKKIFFVAPILLLIGLGALGAYAFIEKLGPFARLPYSEENILSGLLERMRDVSSATYKLYLAINVVPRQEGAVPFTIQVSNEAELREQYQNDYDRAREASRFLSYLENIRMRKTGPLPASIQGLVSSVNSSPTYSTDVTARDPKTGTLYGYKIVDGGSNFELIITFETKNAIAAIRRAYGFSETTTIIQGQTVTFKGSDRLFYFSVPNEPPEPYLVQLGEMSRFLPAEFSIDAMLAGNIAFGDSSKWKFNLSGNGDFGDLSYAIDIDAMKKDTDYYVRLNKIPSIILSTVSSFKDKWIHIDSTASTTSRSYNSLNYYANYFPKIEQSYRERREAFQNFYKKALELADETKLVAFKDEPRSERLEGEMLYRYDLTLRKDAILPFYQKISEEAKKDPELSRSFFFNDQGVVEYLQSDEFQKVYDYLNTYTQLTLWVDPQGYVAKFEILFHAIPPDTATQLANKQMDVTVSLALADINKGVEVEVPTDVLEIENLVQGYDNNKYNYFPGSTESIRAYLRSALTAAIAAQGSNGVFATFAIGPCAQKIGTVFANEKVISNIALAAGGDASKAMCAAQGTHMAISVPLSSVGYSWCVDETGDSRQIRGVITGPSCR